MKRLILFICFVVIRSNIHAQYPFFHHITDEQGLPSNEVYSIVQDAKGFIWVGCDAGLYRYNGIQFKKIANPNQKSAGITGLTLAGDSILYCYNFSNQVFYVKADSLHEISSWQGKRKYGFPSIVTTKDNCLWATSENAIYRFDRKGELWSEVALITSGKTGSVNVMSADPIGNIWFGCDSGIGCLKKNKVRVYPVPFTSGSSLNIADYVLCAATNDVWLVAIAGGAIYRFDGQAFHALGNEQLYKTLQNRKVTSVKIMQSKLYIATYSGLVIYDINRKTIEVLYPQETFSNVLFDTENNLWLTTLRNGIYLIPETQFRVWNKAQSQLPENRVTDICSSSNRIYFSLQSGYIGQLETKTKGVEIQATRAKADIRNLFFDATSQQLIYNTNNSLFAVQANTIQEISSTIGPVKKIIKADGDYIICTSLGAFSYAHLNAIQTRQKLTDAWARDAVFLNASKRLFIATNQGLLRADYAHGQITKDTLLFKDVQVVALNANEKSNSLYALTFKREVFLCNANTCKKLTELPVDTRVYAIASDENSIFVATAMGIWRYVIQQQQWTNINHTSGIASNDVQTLCVQDSTLYLGTAKGLQSIPLQLVSEKPLPKIYLANLVVDGKKNTSTNGLKINYKSTINIALEAVCYSSLQDFKYAYRILEKDSQWQFVNSSNGNILISGIPSGSFTLQAKAVDYRGRFSENTIEINGDVIPPLWQRWWFYILIVMLAVGLVYLFFQKRIRLMKQQQAEVMAKIKLENDLALSQQTALKAQMNPHFIFNVLNSIKSYIYENDKKAAAEYLSKFAELVRSILTMSSMQVVRLDDELKALELYIQLEAMQLDGSFSYTIVVDEGLDSETIAIPSLVIQPFVENAFKHGLRHKAGDKELHIRIKSDNEKRQLIIEIEDNGIGRVQSSVLNQSNTKTHISFATEASTKRLDLLNKSNIEKVSVAFQDKADSDGHPLGTIVILYLPI